MATLIHSMIRVRDEARSLAFYKTAFALDVFDRIPFETFTLTYLRAPGSTFELELTINNDREKPYELGDGYGHLAVSVDDLAAMQRDGAPFARFFFIKDPDGYNIEVLQRGGRFL
jgi:lactoylglutathione lyase